jgi:hypothetical protein
MLSGLEYAGGPVVFMDKGEFQSFSSAETLSSIIMMAVSGLRKGQSNMPLRNKVILSKLVVVQLIEPQRFVKHHHPI